MGGRDLIHIVFLVFLKGLFHARSCSDYSFNFYAQYLKRRSLGWRGGCTGHCGSVFSYPQDSCSGKNWLNQFPDLKMLYRNLDNG